MALDVKPMSLILYLLSPAGRKKHWLYSPKLSRYCGNVLSDVVPYTAVVGSNQQEIE
jgi:hypothetical protein